jgi:hypothetical protein
MVPADFADFRICSILADFVADAFAGIFPAEGSDSFLPVINCLLFSILTSKFPLF